MKTSQFFVLIILCNIFCEILLAQVQTESKYIEEEKLYQTVGHIDFTVEPEKISHIAEDFNNYNKWALNGINGDKDNSRNFLTLITNLEFPQKEKVIMTYDLALPFPFRKNNQTLAFKLVDIVKEKGLLKSYVLQLDDSSIAINDFKLQLSVDSKGEKESRINFVADVKVSFLVGLFFDLNKYKKNVEWRIIKMIDNLENYVQKSMQSSIKPVLP